MKKSLLLFLFLLTGYVYGTAQTILHEDLYYEVIAPGEVELTSPSDAFYSEETSQRANLIIPESITYYDEEYSVVSIRQYALSNCQILVSVTIPNSLRTIKWEAFQGDENLKTIKFGNSVSSIEYGAFNFCTSLTSIDLPASIINIEEIAFANCHSLSSVTLPESLTTISKWTFANCTSLTEIDIPNSVTTIEEGAFSECPLKSIHISDNVTQIGAEAFYCPGLEELYVGSNVNNIENVFSRPQNTIEVSQANPYYTSENNILYDKNRSTLFYASQSVTDVVIPNSVTTIGARAFADSKIKTINISDNVSQIGRSAFCGCEMLVSATIGNSVTKLEDNLFGDCISLKSVKLGNSVSSIGANTFAHCESLKSIDLPGSMRSIGFASFLWCYALENVNFNEGLESLDWEAFAGCKSLKSVKLPNSLKSIEEGAFTLCESLESVTLGASVDSIKIRTFDFCTSLKHIDFANVKFIGNTFKGGNRLENINIPASVDSIDASFIGCPIIKSFNVDPANGKYSSKDGILYTKDMTGLVAYPTATADIKFESSVTKIHMGAFGSNENISSIIIPDNIEIIERYVFTNCSNLASVTLGKSVKSIDSYNFPLAGNMKVVNSRAEEPPVCADYALSALDVNSTVIFVPEGSLSKYKEALQWSDFAKIEEKDYTTNVNYDFESEGGLFNITSGGENLTVEIVGAFTSGQESHSASPRIYNASAKVLAIPETIEWNGETYTVTSIGKNAFSSDMSLGRVDIPASVSLIREGAFAGCGNIRTVKCDASLPPICGEGVWESEVLNNAMLYVPEGTAQTYRSAETWSLFKNISDSDMSGIDTCLDNESDVRISVTDGKVHINGTDNATVEIFDTAGRKVYTGKGNCIVNNLYRGTYILRVGDKALKISL